MAQVLGRITAQGQPRKNLVRSHLNQSAEKGEI
jgi:hypothetical protein